MSSERLMVKVIGAPVPACPSGRHTDHPGMDCDGADEQIAWEEAVWQKHWARMYDAALRTPLADVPESLRGPRWKEATP